MGSKKLKAIVAVGSAEIPLADAEGMKRSINEHRKFMRTQPFFRSARQVRHRGNHLSSRRHWRYAH